MALRPLEEEWRGELNQRFQAYRARRKKTQVNDAQTELPFADHSASASVAIQADDSRRESPNLKEDFAFTIAIGRSARASEPEDPRLLIDVSLPPLANEDDPAPARPAANTSPAQLFPIASLQERRRCALIDAACLAFAYGGFLALFGSLGGEFTLSKLSAVVCFSTFAFVYIQYFCLFTIFGGTTPGMMLRGLQVVGFSGETPTARQLFWRATGYLISAGSFFLGFFWALWDEDTMTWHDRISHTYLAVPETFAETEIPYATPAR